MNTTNRKGPTRIGLKTRFDGRPAPPASFRALQETELDRLKHRLLQERLAVTADPELNAPLRRAANEAAALAWITPAPLLVFPALFEEKARTALSDFALSPLHPPLWPAGLGEEGGWEGGEGQVCSSVRNTSANAAASCSPHENATA